MPYGINNGPNVGDGIQSSIVYNDVTSNSSFTVIAPGAAAYNRHNIQVRFDDASDPTEISAAFDRLKVFIIQNMDLIGR